MSYIYQGHWTPSRTLINIRHIFIKVLEGVQFLHSKGILHNDLKADNIVVCEERVVLIDFGKATMIKCPVTYNIKKWFCRNFSNQSSFPAYFKNDNSKQRPTVLILAFTVSYFPWDFAFLFISPLLLIVFFDFAFIRFTKLCSKMVEKLQWKYNIKLSNSMLFKMPKSLK